uniref:DNA-directed RNA polymerase subunit 2 n=1 Tax=Humicola insolens TaxID=85995 RepID=W8NZ45_HUMIN|nr:DNA-directed RNA polymerase subunit 2 [Mycothermus thermophilus]AHL18120.1 DNA-directed RNA polymerase subunit 2 [Mycothermus thermophilus]AHL18121.1 DNA-directed RNA polymerase subunit 2 [Mycothermus thermophilus]
MNAPDRFELFVLAEGEKKITEKVVSGMANCSDFLLLKEDHTLGNLLSAYLRMAPHVMFAAYKIGHPNVPEVLIRVQTDGVITPREALVTTCKQLVALYGQLGREFQKELALRKYADQSESAAAAAANDASGSGAAGAGAATGLPGQNGL